MPSCAGTEPPSVVGTIKGIGAGAGGDRTIGANVVAQQTLKVAAALGRGGNRGDQRSAIPLA